jgi:hypothetical protein
LCVFFTELPKKTNQSTNTGRKKKTIFAQKKNRTRRRMSQTDRDRRDFRPPAQQQNSPQVNRISSNTMNINQAAAARSLSGGASTRVAVPPFAPTGTAKPPTDFWKDFCIPPLGGM